MFTILTISQTKCVLKTYEEWFGSKKHYLFSFFSENWRISNETVFYISNYKHLSFWLILMTPVDSILFIIFPLLRFLIRLTRFLSKNIRWSMFCVRKNIFLTWNPIEIENCIIYGVFSQCRLPYDSYGYFFPFSCFCQSFQWF